MQPLLAADLDATFVVVMAALFGAAWGSFFNVAIYRWPRGMSVVVPASHCPGCQAKIPGYLNIPVLSYFILRGKTACCGTPLSMRYPFVEFLTGVLAAALARNVLANSPPSVTAEDALITMACYFVFVGGLIIATFVDLERMEIPDEVSLPGAAFGLATASVRLGPGVEAAALGAGGGFLFIQLLFVWGYERIMGRRGMGEGDAKLLMMIGAFIGWRGAMFSLFAGALQGILVAVYGLLTGKSLSPPIDDEEEEDDQTEGSPGDYDDDPAPTYVGHLRVPFGPFLALSAIEYFFFGDILIEFWFTMFERLLG